MATPQGPDPEKSPEKTTAEHSSDENVGDTVPAAVESDEVKPMTRKEIFLLTITTIALMTALFLVALDTNILAIAIPRITTDFGSLDDVAWYSSAYSLTKMALQPAFGRLYYSVRLKLVFCGAVVLFGAGSILCALAPNSTSLIVGRAIQGCGCAGIASGSMNVMAYLVPTEKMAIFTAILSSTYAISSVVGPTLGGVLAESSLTWRFCFWINLPIGAVSCLTIVLAFKEPDRESTKVPLREKLAMLDPLGTSILIAAITALILALQWGGISLPWSNAKVWGCLLSFGVGVAIFIGLQIRDKDKALVPMPILTQRTIAATCATVAFQMMTVTCIMYYLPLFFQASKGFTPTKAGLWLLGFALPNPIFSFIAGAAVTKTGQYIPWLLIGGAMLTVGAGLCSTLTLNHSDLGRVIGFELLASAGFGFAVQQPLVAIRNVLDPADVPMGMALFFFFQAFGQTVGMGIAQVIFLSALRTRLGTRLSDSEVTRITKLGASSGAGVPPDLANFVATSYSHSTQRALYAAIATAGLSFLCAGLLEWRHVEVGGKKKK